MRNIKFTLLFLNRVDNDATPPFLMRSTRKLNIVRKIQNQLFILQDARENHITFYFFLVNKS